jgi:hypothetical protein
MKNNTYMIATIKENEKYYSYVIKHHNSNDLLHETQRIKNLHNMTICDTRKEALTVCEDWNETYKANGTHMFHGNNQPF